MGKTTPHQFGANGAVGAEEGVDVRVRRVLGVVFPMVTLTMSTYQIHTDTEWRFFKVVGRVLAAVLTLTACYIHALTIKHAVTPKFWHGFHPKQT